MEQIQQYIIDLQKTIDGLPRQKIADTIEVLQQARMRGSQVFIMGNGGSASTATHFVCDLAKNTRQPGIPPYRVMGLTDNMAVFSAYSNDDGYENVFSLQLTDLLQPGDVVIAISASGNSKNVVNGIREALKHEVTTIGFTGYDGGLLGQMVDINVHVKSDVIEHVEDIHLMLEHIIICAIKERNRQAMQTPSEVESLPVETYGD